eukprot:jgi/Mesvir1/4364/Mv02444-RA.1
MEAFTSEFLLHKACSPLEPSEAVSLARLLLKVKPEDFNLNQWAPALMLCQNVLYRLLCAGVGDVLLSHETLDVRAQYAARMREALEVNQELEQRLVAEHQRARTLAAEAREVRGFLARSGLLGANEALRELTFPSKSFRVSQLAQMHAAATTIQRHYRGVQGRRKFKRRLDAILYSVDRFSDEEEEDKKHSNNHNKSHNGRSRSKGQQGGQAAGGGQSNRRVQRRLEKQLARLSFSKRGMDALPESGRRLDFAESPTGGGAADGEDVGGDDHGHHLHDDGSWGRRGGGVAGGSDRRAGGGKVEGREEGEGEEGADAGAAMGGDYQHGRATPAVAALRRLCRQLKQDKRQMAAEYRQQLNVLQEEVFTLQSTNAALTEANADLDKLSQMRSEVERLKSANRELEQALVQMHRMYRPGRDDFQNM